MAELTDTELREHVRARYSDAALRMADRDPTAGCGCGCDSEDTPETCCTDKAGTAVFGAELYDDHDTIGAAGAADAALAASLGCGVPTAVADLHEGETVLDLGSGGGIDVLLSARRVGPAGTAYGLDMTDEMLELARANQAKAGVTNVHWLKGDIEAIPLAADSVDVVLSNCVINLSTDKPQVLREAARVLKPGGRFAVSDIVADPDMDDATRADLGQYVGCIAGALSHDEYVDRLHEAGLIDVEVIETHRVHEHAGSAIVRARKPQGAEADGP
jgi:arsenite methyltransferase